MPKLQLKQLLILPITLLLSVSCLVAVSDQPLNKKPCSNKFIVTAKINPKVIKRAYKKLNDKKVNIKDKLSGKTYKNVDLDDLIRNKYREFFPKTWGTSYVKVYEQTEPHFTLAEAGNIISKNGKNYVQSYDGKTEVELKDAINAVKKAINEHKAEYKKLKGQQYKPEIGYNLLEGAKFLYDPKAPSKSNIWIVQELSFGQVGKHHRLYELGKAIQKELKNIGLEPKYYPAFKPHVSIANLDASKNTQIIDKLKDLEKNEKSALHKIFKSVPSTRTKNHKRRYFSEIEVSAGKGMKPLAIYNFQAK